MLKELEVLVLEVLEVLEVLVLEVLKVLEVLVLEVLPYSTPSKDCVHCRSPQYCAVTSLLCLNYVIGL